jgi:hypothetical protein
VQQARVKHRCVACQERRLHRRLQRDESLLELPRFCGRIPQQVSVGRVGVGQELRGFADEGSGVSVQRAGGECLGRVIGCGTGKGLARAGTQGSRFTRETRVQKMAVSQSSQLRPPSSSILALAKLKTWHASFRIHSHTCVCPMLSSMSWSATKNVYSGAMVTSGYCGVVQEEEAGGVCRRSRIPGLGRRRSETLRAGCFCNRAVCINPILPFCRLQPAPRSPLFCSLT